MVFSSTNVSLHSLELVHLNTLLSIKLLGKNVVLGTFLARNKSCKSELLSGSGCCFHPSAQGFLSMGHCSFRNNLSSLVDTQIFLHETSLCVDSGSIPNLSHATGLHLSCHSFGFAGDSL